MGYGAGWREFDSSRSKRFFLFHSVQIDSEAHTLSYIMGTEGKAAGASS
jgi:hypothetical protein